MHFLISIYLRIKLYQKLLSKPEGLFIELFNLGFPSHRDSVFPRNGWHWGGRSMYPPDRYATSVVNELILHYWDTVDKLVRNKLDDNYQVTYVMW